jgi:hypothetical protein
MPTLIVKDVDTRLDGEYECKLDDLTNREFHLIRQMSGIAPTGVVGGLLSQDVGLVVALATVVLEREGKPVNVEALWDAQHGSLAFDFTDAPGDERPPEQPPSGGSDSENDAENKKGSPGSGSGSGKSSGSRRRGPKATGERG